MPGGVRVDHLHHSIHDLAAVKSSANSSRPSSVWGRGRIGSDESVMGYDGKVGV